MTPSTGITVCVSARDRASYIDRILSVDGLSHVTEDPRAAYCPISLTQTPDELKPILKRRQDLLMDGVLKRAGITAYDPFSAPYSPDTNLTSLPGEVYQVDSSKIAGARFFVGHNLVASTGFGVELEKASKLNRMAVILYDRKIRISRMQPHRIIYLQYDRFEEQLDRFVAVFSLLSGFEPGMGFAHGVPVLLGYDGTSAVDLEALVYGRFPDLAYRYDGTADMLRLTAANPQLFTEWQPAG